MNGSSVAKPSHAFRTIAEAADELNVPAHVLRFWEGKFTQLKPLKRAGGRRHYRPDDMALLRGIRALLHEDGYQLKGIQKLLRDQGIAWVRDRGHQRSSDIVHAAPVQELLPVSAAKDFLEPEINLGPLFEKPRLQDEMDGLNSDIALLLRRALTKLEDARTVLDHAAKFYE